MANKYTVKYRFTVYKCKSYIFKRGDLMTEIIVEKGDITKLSDVEAIVNAANSSLLGGGGVDGAIHRAAGRQLIAECRLLGGCKTGQAKITKGYNLKCGYIIHTVGPVWRGGNNNEERLLESCYVNSLNLAAKKGIRTIAFPAISTGVYGYPPDLAAVTVIKAVRKYLKDNPDNFDVIKFVLFDEISREIYENIIKEI